MTDFFLQEPNPAQKGTRNLTYLRERFITISNDPGFHETLIANTEFPIRKMSTKTTPMSIFGALFTETDNVDRFVEFTVCLLTIDAIW